MTGRLPGPHLARSARQPAWPWDTGAAPACEGCATAAALPRSRNSRPGGAATRGHSAPAYRRFSVPQGRPPHPGRWRRGSGCNEALGLTQGRKALPGPGWPRGSACPALAGEGPRRHNVLRTWGERHGGRSGRRTGVSPPLACHVFNIACPLTPLQKGRNPTLIFSLSPPRRGLFLLFLPILRSLLSALLCQGGTSLRLLRAIPGRRRRRSGAGYAGLFLSRLCT